MKTEKQQARIHEVVQELLEGSTYNDRVALADSLIELESSNSYLGKTDCFIKQFKQFRSNIPAFPDSKTKNLSLSLILEELTELAEACGEDTYGEFGILLERKTEEIKGNYKAPNKVKKEGSIVEAFDAYLDLQYVISVGVIAFGLQDIFDTGFEEVHRSNMSKACSSESEASDTKSSYELKGTECFIEFDEDSNKWFVKRTGDKKLLKSILYSPANLEKILYPDGIKDNK